MIAGRVPSIRRPLPGVEQLLEAYGLRPGVDVYIPQPGESAEEIEVNRKRLRDNRAYKAQREKVGVYMSHAERRRVIANKRLRRLTNGT